jgi:hypothetical protein
VQRAAISGSIAAGGRSLSQVRSYSAELADFVSRNDRHGSESFVFLGWATPLLAVAGLVILVRSGRRGLAALLGLGAIVPCLLALGTNLPLYEFLFHHSSVFRYPRVPERLMPIACLALAALVAFAVGRMRRMLLVPVLAIALLAADLHVRVYGSSVADQGNAAYAALGHEPAGRLLELPIFLPDVHYGSVYLYYEMTARRERPGGYSTLAPPVARTLAQRLERLNCGDWASGERVVLARLGVRAVAFHGGLFQHNPAVPDRSWFAWRGLVRAGFRPLARDGSITSFVPGRSSAPPPSPEPDRTSPVFCQGWYQHGASGPMSETHAPFWIYGSGRIRLRVFSYEPLAARIAVDGRTIVRRMVKEPVAIAAPLRGTGWHLVTFDVPHLYKTPGRPIGLELASVATGR